MSDKVTVITNHVPRQMLYGYELTAKERNEFDYLTDFEIDTHDFVRYRGWVYDIDDTMAITDLDRDHPQREWMRGWDSYVSDSYFSGVLFKLVGDGHVICATYIC
jgi:hypothetical protein